jgi:hypothetical protein
MPEHQEYFRELVALGPLEFGTPAVVVSMAVAVLMGFLVCVMG